MHPTVIIAKCWKQPEYPLVNEWIKNLWYIYTTEHYTAERKKKLLPFVTAWVELEGVMLNEISQAVKDKYHMTSPISDADPGPQGRCVVAAINKFTGTTEVLWRKRDGMAAV